MDAPRAATHQQVKTEVVGGDDGGHDEQAGPGGVEAEPDPGDRSQRQAAYRQPAQAFEPEQALVQFRTEDEIELRFGQLGDQPVRALASASRASGETCFSRYRSQGTQAFYEFLKTMEIYRTTLDSETSLILSTEGEFYKFIKQSGR